MPERGRSRPRRNAWMPSRPRPLARQSRSIAGCDASHLADDDRGLANKSIAECLIGPDRATFDSLSIAQPFPHHSTRVSVHSRGFRTPHYALWRDEELRRHGDVSRRQLSVATSTEDRARLRCSVVVRERSISPQKRGNFPMVW
jgi:hypothetical protein